MTEQKHIGVRINPDDAIKYVNAVDKTEHPWEFSGFVVPQLEYEAWALDLQLRVDGEKVPMSITLYADGTWSANAGIPI